MNYEIILCIVIWSFDRKLELIHIIASGLLHHNYYNRTLPPTTPSYSMGNAKFHSLRAPDMITNWASLAGTEPITLTPLNQMSMPRSRIYQPQQVKSKQMCLKKLQQQQHGSPTSTSDMDICQQQQESIKMQKQAALEQQPQSETRSTTVPRELTTKVMATSNEKRMSFSERLLGILSSTPSRFSSAVSLATDEKGQKRAGCKHSLIFSNKNSSQWYLWLFVSL